MHNSGQWPVRMPVEISSRHCEKEACSNPFLHLLKSNYTGASVADNDIRILDRSFYRRPRPCVHWSFKMRRERSKIFHIHFQWTIPVVLFKLTPCMQWATHFHASVGSISCRKKIENIREKTKELNMNIQSGLKQNFCPYTGTIVVVSFYESPESFSSAYVNIAIQYLLCEAFCRKICQWILHSFPEHIGVPEEPLLRPFYTCVFFPFSHPTMQFGLLVFQNHCFVTLHHSPSISHLFSPKFFSDFRAKYWYCSV